MTALARSTFGRPIIAADADGAATPGAAAATGCSTAIDTRPLRNPNDDDAFIDERDFVGAALEDESVDAADIVVGSCGVAEAAMVEVVDGDAIALADIRADVDALMPDDGATTLAALEILLLAGLAALAMLDIPPVSARPVVPMLDAPTEADPGMAGEDKRLAAPETAAAGLASMLVEPCISTFLCAGPPASSAEAVAQPTPNAATTPATNT
ncbi:MAG: hypothetical protein ACLP8A_11960 [Methylovirgula sp.]